MSKGWLGINWFGTIPSTPKPSKPNQRLRTFLNQLEVAKSKSSHRFTTDLNRDLCLDDLAFLIHHYLGERNYRFQVTNQPNGDCKVSVERNFSIDRKQVGPFPSQ
jgi:hypothetical protein